VGGNWGLYRAESGGGPRGGGTVSGKILGAWLDGGKKKGEGRGRRARLEVDGRRGIGLSFVALLVF